MRKRYVSDVMVDVLRRMGIEYIALNPGGSFSGLHESIVNYGGDREPKIILCNHENIAVAIAHGYAKAAGKPMAVATHNVVGLLNANLGIYLDWLDQSPVIIFGGAHPSAIEERETGVWQHVALSQGDLADKFLKWHDQPASVESLFESLYRAYRVAVSEPKGPVYLCINENLQTQVLDEDFRLPDLDRYPVSTSPQADVASIEKLAGMLVKAERPLVMADYLGRNPGAVASLVELAELLAAPVIDCGSRFNFPSSHPLDLSSGALQLTPSDEELVRATDLILGLDMRNFYHYLSRPDHQTGRSVFIAGKAKVAHIGIQELGLRSWSPHLGKLTPIDLSILADTSLALPVLTKMCQERMAVRDPIDRQKRSAEIKAKHDAMRQNWQKAPAKTAKEKPVSLPFLVGELGEVIKNEDWVLASRAMIAPVSWARRLWDWDRPYRWLGAHGPAGLSSGLGNSIGAALAYRDAGRIVVDIQADGDFLFAPSALWTVARYKVPLLIVMFNNRSYYAVESRQMKIAEERGSPILTAATGTHIDEPAVDFGALARSFGVYGEGPIEDPEKVRPALERALRHIKETGTCALVDIVTQPR